MLKNGVSGIDFLSSFETQGLPCRIGGQVDDSWLNALPAKGLQGIEKCNSRGLKLMISAVSEAVESARLDSIENRDRIGVSLGYHGENPSVEDMLTLYRYSGKDVWDIRGLTANGVYSFFNFFRRKPDVATSILSILFNCRGSNITTVSACAAGAQAIGEAFGIIREGRADVMIAGGCESNLNFSGFIGFVLIRALSERYSSPEKASRPFDRKKKWVRHVGGSRVARSRKPRSCPRAKGAHFRRSAGVWFVSRCVSDNRHSSQGRRRRFCHAGGLGGRRSRA